MAGDEGLRRGSAMAGAIWVLATVIIVVAAGIAAGQRVQPERAGSFITDDEGRALILRGFNNAGSAKVSSDGVPADFTEDDVARDVSEMGTNFVRFLISWRKVEPAPGDYDEAYLDAVEERVNWYADHGVHVMLDMHQDLYGPIRKESGEAIGNGAPEWATFDDGLPVGEHEMWELHYLDPSVERAFDHFWNTTDQHDELAWRYARAWRAVAEHFAEVEGVIGYDLFNEPFGGSLQGSRFESGPLTKLYQDATNKIREVDEDSWICLEPQAVGTNWGTPSGLRPINDPRSAGPRLAYCPHLYPLSIDPGEGYSGSSRKLVDATISVWRDNTLRTAEKLGDVPVILGEFGLDLATPGALDYVDSVQKVSAESGLGLAYWVRDDVRWGPYDEAGAPTGLVGVLNRPYPRAIAGTPREWSASPDSLEFTFTPDQQIAAPTEVYLPAATFTGDPTVSGATVAAWDPETRILELSVDGETPVTVRVTP